MKIEIAGLPVELLLERAALLSDRTLVVGDIHLGKASAFQARGIAIPEGASTTDLDRLTMLCREHRASRLVINGDLFHSRGGFTRDIALLFESWIDSLGLPVELVIGNHDLKIARLPMNLPAVPFASHGGFRMVHDPAEATDDVPSIAAHWHPVVKVGDGKSLPMRFPCFLVRGNLLVLPAFGTFTGGLRIKPEPGDRCFVSPGPRLIEVPPALLR